MEFQYDSVAEVILQSAIVRKLEGGVRIVCEVMQKYIDIEVKKNNVEKIVKMIKNGYSKEDILDLDYTEDEYTEAESELLQLV